MKKLIKKSFHRKEKGFTLIELLIVIVIIGILAGVLIAVINPVRQQNRARNAAVRAAVLKVAFGINTVKAGTGTLPSETDIQTELENISVFSTTCATAGTLDCFFTVSGTSLPTLCTTAAGDATPDGGANGCQMHVLSTSSDLRGGQFRVAAPKFPLNPAAPVYEYYLFDSGRGLLECPIGQSYAATISADALFTGGCVNVSE